MSFSKNIVVKGYAKKQKIKIIWEFIDVETLKKDGIIQFKEMLGLLEKMKVSKLYFVRRLNTYTPFLKTL